LLLKLLERVKRDSPDFYINSVFRKPAMQIVVFGIDHSVPAFVTMDLVVVSGPLDTRVTNDPLRSLFPRLGLDEAVRLDTHIDGCPLKSSVNESVMRPLGRTEVIDGIRWEENKFWKWFGDVEGAAFLVRLETLAASENVGEPIDVIYIDAKGATWKYHKPECPDIQPILAPKTASPKQPAKRATQPHPKTPRR
ncbi:MAG: hypothetical protein WAV47_26830, partial [Blastocatellia bacterium]